MSVVPDTESSWDVRPGEPLLPGLLAWERLGDGAHCETWLAWSEPRWSAVAVKLPRPEEQYDADVRHDLVLESWARERVDHPGVQRMWEARLQDPVPHLVLEYVEGPTIESYVGRGKLTVADVLLVGLQVVAALRHIHLRGLVHLDVKPGNLVLRDGRPVLLDLGIATAAGGCFPVDDAPGTPAYLAPEVAAGDPVSAAADTYALGVSMRDLMPHGQDGAVGDLLAAMCSARPEARPDDDALLLAMHEALPDGSTTLWPDWATTSLLPHLPRRGGRSRQ
jgi:serine/threonine protein kinase